MACSSSSSIQSVFEGFDEFCEESSVLLMSLMEETQEDHYQNCEDERLVCMIRSLEAEINSRNPMLIMEQVHGQDCSTSSSSSSVTDADYDWVMDMEEVVPSISSPFDDDLNAWSACEDMREDCHSHPQFYCGVSWVASDDVEL